ncbi:MAG: hypothetical protein ABH852_01375 [Methanobacteriota archaeon]
MDIVAKLTLAFSGTGAIAGLISGFMPNAWLALLTALVLLYASYKLTTYYLKKSEAQPTLPVQQTPEQALVQTPAQTLPGRKKTVLKGFMILFTTLVTKGETDEKETVVKFWFLPYYIMWLVLWIMVYTLLLLR